MLRLRPCPKSWTVINTGSCVYLCHQSRLKKTKKPGTAPHQLVDTLEPVCELQRGATCWRNVSLPQSVLSSLVSSYQQPPEVGSTPDGSTVQLSTSGEEDLVRGSFRRYEDKRRVTAPRLHSSSFPRLTGEKSFPVNALCSSALAISLFLFNFSHLWATAMAVQSTSGPQCLDSIIV